MNRILLRSAAVLVSLTFLHSGETDGIQNPYEQAIEYFSFEEWSNAHHGISKEQQEEDERKRQAYFSQKYGDETSDEEEPQRKLKQSVYEDMPYLKQYLKDQQEYEESLKKEEEKTNFVIHDSLITGALKGFVVGVVFLLIKKYRNRK